MWLRVVDCTACMTRLVLHPMSADARVLRPIRSTHPLASFDTTLSVLEAFGLFLSRLDALRKSHDSGTWHCDTTFCDYVSRPMMRLATVPAFYT